MYKENIDHEYKIFLPEPGNDILADLAREELITINFIRKKEYRSEEPLSIFHYEE